MKHLAVLSAIILFSLNFANCATTGATTSNPSFHVYVDSYLSDIPQDRMKTCVLLPGEEGVSASDLQFKEFAKYVGYVLAQKGYRVVEPGGEPAQYAILVRYGISNPEKSTVNVPTFGQTGYSSSRTTGMASVYGNTGTYSGTTSYTPSYGITGYVPVSRTSYTRYLAINAIDLPKYIETQEVAELWRTVIVSSGSSGDLRRVLPILVAAGSPYLESNTGQQVKVVLHETDPEVQGLKEVINPTPDTGPAQ